MARWILALAVLAWSTAAFAADQPQYAPPAAWVKPTAIPDIPPPTDGSVVQLLLADSQARFGSEEDEFYAETAMKILAPQGLTAAASIPLGWSPDTETLIIHHIDIIRGGKRIDLLAGGKNVTILRRESNLELAMLDGRLTATLQPEGLQVGDTVDIALTRVHRDPVMKGRSEAMAAVRHTGIAGHIRMREIWADAKPMRWRTTTGFPDPRISRGGGMTELVIDQSNVTAPKPPREAPPRFEQVGVLQTSQFQSWDEVSALMAPLYDKAATLSSDSPLRAEVEKIRKASSDPKIQAEAALRLVQDQVRYVALLMNFGGYVPAEADLTWSRRFGDCKGKTVLLLALLRGLGITAEPALVSTQAGDTLYDGLPMLNLFDHVFVRAVIGGKTYWLDGTRSEDRGLDDIPIPDFRWVLPVQATGAQLTKVQPEPYAIPAFEGQIHIDASAGYEAPAKVHAEHLFRNDGAVVWKVALNNLGRADADRLLREYWRGAIPWSEATAVNFIYDDQHHVMRLTMDGQGKMDWTPLSGVRDFDIGESSLGFTTSFKRDPGPNADAPFSVPYPFYEAKTVTIVLPNKGQGFRLLNAANLDSTVAARRFQRRSWIENGVVTMIAQQQNLAPEFLAKDPEGVASQLRIMGSTDVVVRGPETSGEPAASAVIDETVEEPRTVGDFTRRGATFLNLRDYGRAIADFSAAIRLEPHNGRHFYNRGAAFLGEGQQSAALDDFDQAIRLNPNDTLAHLARAELLLSKGETRRAESDFDTALTLAPNDPSVLRRRAEAYEDVGRYGDAVREYDALLKRTPSPTPQNLRNYLNARCWARAEWGQQLDLALADCNAALALQPGSAAVLDSRGFVELRMGQYGMAITDYDAALNVAAELPSSLFGRGVAKLRKGDAVGSVADLGAARAAAPGIDAQFAKYGVTATH